MTTAPTSTLQPTDEANDQASWKILLPYGLAILAQLPMLVLYFKLLWNRPHYQPFAIAIIATFCLAYYRWPFNIKRPFHRSLASDVLIVMGLSSAVLGAVFVEPWFAALSVMLIVTSLFARTQDKESESSLWPCALPLYVYLILPAGLDVRLITKLQLYSAVYTSRILDLVGLGHYMDGTVINIPNMREYGIEQACSGVQSFFTLLLIAVIFIVMSRRLKVPSISGIVLSIFLSVVCFLARAAFFASDGIGTELMLLAGVGFLIHAAFGFRATILLLSAVFWAVFMNTIRILSIPLAEYYLQANLSEGLSHDILGYGALALGILLLFSTDQFLLFLFGRVEPSSGEAGPFGVTITRFWNNVLSGSTEESPKRKKKRARSRTLTPSSYTFLWVFAGLMLALGLWQLVDVQRSLASSGYNVRFFDVDVMVEFGKDDLPEMVDSWKLVDYENQNRGHASDLGQRSDVWQFASPRCAAVASFDQTFPGWHELTTCYRNRGWKLLHRKVIFPNKITGIELEEGEKEWGYIEATFEKNTGEKGYLLFSHFDAFGNGLDVPGDWNFINSFLMRAKNRMSHRIRAELFQGEAYQVQVFLVSYRKLDDDLKLEVNQRYLTIRDNILNRFIEKKEEENKEEEKKGGEGEDAS